MGGEGEEEGANLIGWSFSCFRFQYAHKIASLEAMQVQNYGVHVWSQDQEIALHLLRYYECQAHNRHAVETKVMQQY